jgi:hypothetical protein
MSSWSLKDNRKPFYVTWYDRHQSCSLPFSTRARADKFLATLTGPRYTDVKLLELNADRTVYVEVT